MFTKLLINESGQAMAEYGLILGFVAIVAIALLLGIQMPLKTFFDGIDSELIRYTS